MSRVLILCISIVAVAVDVAVDVDVDVDVALQEIHCLAVDGMHSSHTTHTSDPDPSGCYGFHLAASLLLAWSCSSVAYSSQLAPYTLLSSWLLLTRVLSSSV